MLDAPYVMKMAQNLARHSGARQAQIAKNIANADTPGYRTRDLKDFSAAFGNQHGTLARTTREKHILGGSLGMSYATFDVGGEASPNGNNVAVEIEMARGTEAKSSHDLALTIYKSSLDILRSSLGRGR